MHSEGYFNLAQDRLPIRQLYNNMPIILFIKMSYNRLKFNVLTTYLLRFICGKCVFGLKPDSIIVII